MNHQTTKLRILYQRAERNRVAAEKAAEEALLIARKARDQAWIAYVNAAHNDGFCAACETPLAECRCVVVGSASRLVSERFACNQWEAR